MREKETKREKQRENDLFKDSLMWVVGVEIEQKQGSVGLLDSAKIY